MEEKILIADECKPTTYEKLLKAIRLGVCPSCTYRNSSICKACISHSEYEPDLEVVK